MARARMIAKSLSTSERRARLHVEARGLAEFCQALYPLLVAHADDWGRLEGSAFHVKHAIEPASPRTLEQFAAALQALHKVGLITWYEADGRKFISINDFKKYQPGLKVRGESTYPEPAVECRDLPRNAAESTAPHGTSSLTELNLTEQNLTEQNLTEQNRRELNVTEPPAAVVTDFDRFWELFPKKVGKDEARRSWAKAKPSIDVVIDALIKQREWLLRDGGKYIPNPATWINQGRWQDEPPILSSALSETARYNLAASDEADRMILEEEARRGQQR